MGVTSIAASLTRHPLPWEAMSGVDIVRLRLRNQQIAQQDFRTPAELVSHLGAVQAQDFSGGKWAIGLRLPNATEAAIEQAIADQKIVRTWPMRRTLHFVPAEDVRWMLALTATRAEAKSAARRRQLELDDRTLALSKDVLLRALSCGKQRTRQAIYGLLVAAGIRLEGGGPLDSGQPRGLHILAYHAQTGLICYGRHQGKQPAFALLDATRRSPSSRSGTLRATARPPCMTSRGGRGLPSARHVPAARWRTEKLSRRRSTE
ncbi:MAG: winged helix DNA-binding domain-containing protein [Chloroflexi bacterium]|nr:MAG: winged helix DNA-binding domain-containing protein [Chloroflexota bacterium]